MKKEDIKKLRNLKLDELRKTISKAQTEIQKLKMEKEAGKHKDLHTYIKKRKEIAVMLTILKEQYLLKINENKSK